jgi:hypothetical protein
MSVFRSIINALIYSNLYLSSTSAAIYWAISRYMHLKFDPELAFISFSVPLLYYNLCQFIGLRGKEKEDMTPLQHWVATNMTELLFGLFFVFLSSLLFIYQQELYLHIISSILLCALGFLYLFFNKYIQQTTLLKPTLISLSWCALPSFVFGLDRMMNQLPLMGILALFIFSLCIVYDNKEQQPSSLIIKLGRLHTSILLSMLHGIIFLIALSLPSPISVPGLLSGLGISLLVLLIGTRVKEELWHLIITDGLIFIFALLLGLN